MVRETRFAFDGDSNQRPDTTPEDFTEEDDLFLDSFSPPTARDKSAKARKSRARPKKSDTTGQPSASSDQSRDDRRGHLADADWLTPPRQKGKPRKREAKKT